MEVTRKMLEQGKSAAGGWSARQLSLLRVPWPPPRGWAGSVLGRTILESEAAEFVRLGGGPRVCRRCEHARCNCSEPDYSAEEYAALPVRWPFEPPY